MHAYKYTSISLRCFGRGLGITKHILLMLIYYLRKLRNPPPNKPLPPPPASLCLSHSLTRTHAHTHTHALTHARTHAHTHTHPHARTHACTHARSHTHTLQISGHIHALYKEQLSGQTPLTTQGKGAGGSPHKEQETRPPQTHDTKGNGTYHSKLTTRGTI